MANETPSIFNKRASEKLRSPDDLDRYLKVSNPSIWLILGACASLLAGILVWGAFGSIEASVTAMGTVVDDKAMCFVSPDFVSRIQEGDVASFGGKRMQVKEISKVPYSQEEARSVLGTDYLVSALVKDEYDYLVTFATDGETKLEEGVPVNVIITVDRVSPISLIIDLND